ncbi:MAG TPA: hypothetical protein DCR21_00215 [Succinivibrionaceae bacterium]|nr:hypothetical protein [Succinivibrionaceae bacterium]
MPTLILQLCKTMGWYLACVAAGAFLAWHFTAGHYQAELLRIESETQIELQKALVAKADMEARYNAQVSELYSELHADTNKVNADYSAAVANFSDVLNSHWLQSHNASSSENVSTTSGITKGDNGKVSAPCKCDGYDRAKLQRLFEQQMIVARDCDINQNHFKRVVSLYESIRNQ